MGPQVVPVIGSDIRAVTGNQEEYHIGSAVLISVILAEVHLGVKRLEGGKEDGVALELMGVGAGEGHVHGTQNVKVRVKLVERVVIVVITNTTHRFNLSSKGKGETLIVMAINHGFIEVNRRVVTGNIIIKLPVRVINQNNQSTEFAVVHVTSVAHASQQIVAMLQHLLATLHHVVADQALGQAGKDGTVGCGALCLIACDKVSGDQTVTVKTGIGIKTSLILDHGIAIDGSQVVKELVTMQNHGEFGTIRLCHLARGRVGRNRSRNEAHQSQCKKQ